MIQYNNSNPDYGSPEYEGGDDTAGGFQLPTDNDDDLNTLVVDD
jgi:hypothetical protein